MASTGSQDLLGQEETQDGLDLLALVGHPGLRDHVGPLVRSDQAVQLASGGHRVLSVPKVPQGVLERLGL